MHCNATSGGARKAAWAKREKDRKLVITMASYALQRHLGWRTQSRLGQKFYRTVALLHTENVPQIESKAAFYSTIEIL